MDCAEKDIFLGNSRFIRPDDQALLTSLIATGKSEKEIIEAMKGLAGLKKHRELLTADAKKKYLIVSNYWPIADLLSRQCERIGEAEVCAHCDALNVCVRENPTHILILDYDESAYASGEKDGVGVDTWIQLADRGWTKKAKFMLFGYNDYNFQNYFRFPYDPKLVKNALEENIGR